MLQEPQRVNPSTNEEPTPYSTDAGFPTYMAIQGKDASMTVQRLTLSSDIQEHALAICHDAFPVLAGFVQEEYVARSHETSARRREAWRRGR